MSTTHEDISNIIANEKLARSTISNKWLELWSLYKTRPIVVSEDEGWKSKLNDGRVFELVETVASYIRNAMFYSDRWATIESNEPGLAEIVPLVSAYFVSALNNSNFKREFRLFLTQLLLTGFSGIRPYWEEDNDCIAFETINSYDLHVESSRRYDERFSYSFRTIELNRAEYETWVSEGLIEVDDVEESWQKYAGNETQRQAELYNLRDIAPTPDKETIILSEYHCPNEQMLYRVIENDCVFEAEVKECPWLIGLLFETPEDSYPLSLIESSIGLILANNILHNRRLDNIALSIDNMWLFVDDGITNPSDIKNKPGNIISVGRQDVLTPLAPPTNNFNVTYQEQQVLDSKIDRNIGTGAMISANSYRQGERVTKAEIESVKDAGGNRLTDIYEHIESNIIIPLLKRCLMLFRKHTKKSKVVKLASDKPNIYDYYEMLPKDLRHDFSISITGTQSVINRDRNVSLLRDFITLVASVPQFQQLIDYRNLYYDLLVKFGFDDPARYIIEQQEQEAPAAPQSPLQQLGAEAKEIGGNPMASALQSQVAQGNAPDIASMFAGLDPTTNVDSTAANLQLSTPT